MQLFLVNPFLLVGIRLIIGSIFVLSGAFKFFESPEDFMYIAEVFAVLPAGTPLWFYDIVRIGFSSVELIVGCLVILSLWLRWSLWVVAGLLVFFSGLIISTTLRGIPVINCGCFGSSGLLDLLGESDNEVLIRDLILLGGVGWLLYDDWKRRQ